MDVDASPIPRNDELIAYFPIRPEEFPWSSDVREYILARRAAMSGLLFFDILLRLGGIDDPISLYPPVNLQVLKRLLDAIEAASYDAMKRDCLVYYLLKQNSDGREVGYVSEKVISPHYVALADVYWELDSGINLDGALSKLSDARIVKEYTTKIMETLELDPGSAALIRKFVRTCKPALNEPVNMERYIIATAEHSIVEAWKFQRKYPNSYPPRKALLYKLLQWTLTPKPKSQPLTQLLALPLSKYEENVLQEFAIHPPEALLPSSVAVVRDLVCVRLIQSCKYTAAVRFVRQYPSSIIGPRGTWSSERERIVKDILSIMPATQRDMLGNELNAIGEDVRIRTSTSGSTSANRSWTTSNMAASGSTDLGSWEDIGRRTASTVRKSFGGRPRTSLANGLNTKPSVFSPNASTSSTREGQQPLSAQSTVVSQNDTVSSSADSPSGVFSHAANNIESPSSAARLFAQKAPATPKPNGVTNGTPKANAFTSCNAFFQPQAPSSPDPELPETSRPATADSTSARRGPARSAARLPTPPQEDTEKTQESPVTEEQQNGRTDASSSTSVDGEDETQAGDERADLGYSIFAAQAAEPVRTNRPTATSGGRSPKNGRKPYLGEYEHDEGSENQRKKLKVSVPGAFVTDDDHEPELPSPTSATVNKHNLRMTPSRTMRRTPSRTTPSRRSASRKRAASPSNSADNDDIHNLSIPGTLYEEDEENTPKIANGRIDAQSSVDSEEADELAPLPTSRSRRKTDSSGSFISSAGIHTPRRGGRSTRGNSVEPGEGTGVVPPSTGRPVRRSTRLHSGEASPAVDQSFVYETKKDGRSKKGARTASAAAGAGTTGRTTTRRK